MPATTLKNIVQFAGLVVGVPVAIPHGINLLGVPKAPHITIPRVAGFVVAVDTVNVTVTRVPTSPGPDLDVFVWFFHTIDAVFPAPVTTTPAGFPFILQPGGSSVASPAPVTCFVYRPGGVPVANVYTTWPTLMAAVATVDGCKEILVDDSIAAAFTTAGIWDLTETTLLGDLSLGSALTVIEGTILNGLRNIADRLTVTFTGVTPPVADFVVAPFELFVIERGARIVSAGGPFLQMTAATGLVVTFLHGGGFDPGAVVADVAIAGATLIVQVGDKGVLSTATVSSVLGSVFVIEPFVSSADLSESQPGVLGTQLFSNDTRARFTIIPGIAGAYGAGPNELVECDASGGPFPVTLPPAFNNRGRHVCVKKTVSTGNAVTILPGGGDTIDGGASAVLAALLGSIVLVSDGVSNWDVVVLPVTASATPVTCFVYRPGGVPAGNVYTTWPTLVAALGTVDGCKVAQIDDSLDRT